MSTDGKDSIAGVTVSGPFVIEDWRPTEGRGMSLDELADGGEISFTLEAAFTPMQTWAATFTPPNGDLQLRYTFDDDKAANEYERELSKKRDSGEFVHLDHGVEGVGVLTLSGVVVALAREGRTLTVTQRITDSNFAPVL